jgi:hypothetical protein
MEKNPEEEENEGIEESRPELEIIKVLDGICRSLK